MCEKHGLFFVYGLGNWNLQKLSHELPETVLRMTIVELVFPGLHGREASEDQNAVVFIEDRLKGVLDVGVAWWKRSHIWIHENLLSAGTFAQKTRCGLCIAGTVTSALNCMLFSPGSQYHRFEAVQPSFFSSDPVLYSYVKMMFMQRMNKKNGTDIVCEQ